MGPACAICTKLVSHLYEQALQVSEMASIALHYEELAEDEMQPAPKLLEVILQNCKGRVDECLPLYIQASAISLRVSNVIEIPQLVP